MTTVTNKDGIEFDIDAIATDLNNKTDRDLENVSDNTSCIAIDGQWVNSLLLITGSTTSIAVGSYSFSLSEYLPNDNYNYEVMFHLYTTANATTAATVTTDIFTIHASASYAQASYSSSGGTRQVNDFILPVGTNRTVNLEIVTNDFTTLHLRAFGYRRIGTNQ